MSKQSKITKLYSLLACLMCTGMEPQTWLQASHNVDQNLYLQQLYPCKNTGKKLITLHFPYHSIIAKAPIAFMHFFQHIWIVHFNKKVQTIFNTVGIRHTTILLVTTNKLTWRQRKTQHLSHNHRLYDSCLVLMLFQQHLVSQ